MERGLVAASRQDRKAMKREQCVVSKRKRLRAPSAKLVRSTVDGPSGWSRAWSSAALHEHCLFMHPSTKECVERDRAVIRQAIVAAWIGQAKQHTVSIARIAAFYSDTNHRTTAYSTRRNMGFYTP